MLLLLFFLLLTGSFAFHLNRCGRQKLKTNGINNPLYRARNIACDLSGNSEGVTEADGAGGVDGVDTVIEAITPEKRKMSWPFTMFDAPDVLDGSLAGDAGFDPLGVAKDQESLFLLREAEIKHARLAMLAAVGWPVSELYHYQLSLDFGLQNELIETAGRAPSVLNGGLDNINVLLSLGIFIATGGVLEFELMRRRKEVPEDLRNFFDMWREDGWDMPGNYGFDPMQFGTKFCPDDRSKRLMGTVEIFNGRMAMLAMVGFAVQEYTTGMPVIRETPQFFFVTSLVQLGQ